MKDILHVSEVASILLHKDKRFKATLNWLKKHNVSIYPKGKNNSPKFVLKNEFYPIYNSWCKGTISVSEGPGVDVEFQNEYQPESKGSEMKKIELKEKQATVGLFLRCKCKKEYKHEGLVTCGCTVFKYKARIHIPGKGKEEIRRTLNATNYNDAIIELVSLKKEAQHPQSVLQSTALEVYDNNSNKPFYSTLLNNYESVHNTKKNSVLLNDAINRYVDSLFDTEDRKLSIENNNEAIRFFKYAITALNEAHIDTNTLLFEAVDYDMMKIIRAYFKNNLDMSPPYFNKALGRMSSLWAYTIIVYRLSHCVNLFDPKVAKRMSYCTNPVAFPYEKFEELLSVVTYENGWKYIRKKLRNLYRPFLKDLYKVALFTGGRRDVVVGIKWSDIIFKNGRPDRIVFEAKKENLAKQITQDKYKKRYTLTLNKEILDFLIEKGLYQKRGLDGAIFCDEYIIAPEKSRNNLKRLLTDSFPHFYSKISSGEKFLFKQLRKTYLTKKELDSLNSKQIDYESGHAQNSRIIKEAYIDKNMVASAKAGKPLFDSA